MDLPPSAQLGSLAATAGLDVTSLEFASLMDEKDSIRHLKEEFLFSGLKTKSGSREPVIYFASNRRGLPAKKAKNLALEVMNSWVTVGVECHFVQPLPAATCEEYIVDQMIPLVGAQNRDEVAAMNDVDVDLHLMLVSFYRPVSTRKKILVDGEGDYLNIPKSHITQHGYKPTECLVTPSNENGSVGTHEFLELIESEGDGISTILLPSILPKSGTLLDMEKITKAGHEKGCMVGFIMSDAVGNVELTLHDWQVDFACWDTGKYLGAGPSATGCAFLHSNHARHNYPIFTGWWSHRFSSRFEMTNDLERSPGITGYKISNQSPIKIAQLKAVLDIYGKTSISAIREKSVILTGYFQYVFEQLVSKSSLLKDTVLIITPNRCSERGAQMSLRISMDAEKVCDCLEEKGILCSFIAPDILTVCLAPLICGFNDVYRFVSILIDILSTHKA